MKLFQCNPLVSQGVAPMSEPITVTYLDLDRLIDTCGLTESERKIVELLMQGYTKPDIREMTKAEASMISKLYNSAIEKIVEQNECEWHHSISARFRKNVDLV